MAGFRLSDSVTNKIDAGRQRALQASKGARNLEEAYSRFNREQYTHFFEGKEPEQQEWKDFFRWHSRNVSDASEEARGGNACILGAGPCNDIPLEELARRFSQVSLVDMDPEAPELARSRLPLELRWKVPVYIADASAFISDFVARSEEIIGSAESTDEAAQKILNLLSSSYTVNDLIPMGLEYGSMDFVASTDLLSNILMLPLHYLENRISERFGDDFSFMSDPSDDKIFAASLGSHASHVMEARRLLSENGIMLVSPCSAYATMMESSLYPQEGERVVYAFPDESGNMQFVTMPRLGFLGNRHITLFDLLPPMAKQFGLEILRGDRYAVPISKKQRFENTPNFGDVEVHHAALYELMVMKG
jgi:hypothetical protein